MMSSRNGLLKQCVAMACLSLVLLGRCGLAESAVTCALLPDSGLGFSESAAFELAQVELSKQPGVALLERSEIDKVLQEQSFQMAFAPEGGADRRQLGNLLKADILVILHARGTEEVRSLDIVIAETKTGLRVLTDIVSWDEKDPLTTVSEISGAVKRGLAKASEPTRMIAAVPPFVSDDLSH